MMDIDVLKKLTAYVSEVKKTLMVAGKDYIVQGNNQYTARSGFAKLAQGFNLSDRPPIITAIPLDAEPVEYTFKIKVGQSYKDVSICPGIQGFDALVTVVNQYGREATGEGSCTYEELALTNNLSAKYRHRAMGTAKTRAYNRAVSNFVGSADVSAEELGVTFDGADNPVGTPGNGDNAAMVVLPDKLKATGKTVYDRIAELGNWNGAQTAVRMFVSDAGAMVEGNLDVKGDGIKVQVGPAKGLTFEDKDFTRFAKLMQKEGFRTGTGQFLRLNKKDFDKAMTKEAAEE